ncbi:MAG: CPBP family intramembrane metalloprotease [Candidatus Eremiobacteraeota bacterium]|nr:CPBP family intramembrane metalloprotease [Candidatus Eremiobacteraeota bacterium]
MSAPTLTAPPARRGISADRIAVPFWNGILSALGAMVIGIIGMFVALIVIMVAFMLATGHMPSTNPGHPLLASAEVIVYIVGGAFAWWRLRAIGRNPFRRLTGSDGRVLLIGVGALILVHVGTAVQLYYTGQTKHVQTGLEHFTVVSKVPAVTTLSIALVVVATVVLAPIVEEMIFRALLFGALAPRMGVLAGALLTAILFGATHGDLVLFPTLAALGFIAALAYAATGNLWVSIALHALNNALGAAVLVAGSLHHTSR